MGRRIPDRARCCMNGHVLTLPVAPEGRDFRGDLDIHVDVHGAWHYNHSPVRRHAMVCLFASMLVRDAEGGYWLVTPTELGRIQVDDAPLLVVEVIVTGNGAEQSVCLLTNVDQLITVTTETPLTMGSSPVTGMATPYVTNDQGITAKLTRAAYYSLVAYATEQAGQLGVWSEGAFFLLGAAMEPDA